MNAGSDNRFEIETYLLPAPSAGAGAKAEAEFEVRSDRTEFKVEIEDAPIGDYRLVVDGVERATIGVVSTDSGPEGEVEFRDPVEPGKILLDFDPTNVLIEVYNPDDLLVFAGIIAINPDSFPRPGDDDSDDDSDDLDGDGRDRDRIESRLIPGIGVDSTAKARARFEQRRNRREFSVEIEDMPIGDYELLVAGVSRAAIAVVPTATGTEGEVEFRDPVEPGKILLDFDPFDVLIEILDDMGVVFSGVLEPGAAGVDGGLGLPPGRDADYNKVRFRDDFDAALGTDANGTIKINSKKFRVNMKLILKRLEPGEHMLMANGMEVLRFTPNRRGKAKLRLSTKAGGNRIPLDFDPTGTSYEVCRDGTPVLTADVPPSPVGGGALPFGKTVRFFANAGVDVDANGKAQFGLSSNEQEFEVEVEDIDAGAYDLLVDGLAVGLINVTEAVPGNASSTRGSIEFSTQPDGPGQTLLTFDPRGSLVQIASGTTVYLALTMPE